MAATPPNQPHVVALVITDAIPMFEFAVPCEVFGLDRRDIVDPWYELRLCAGEPGPLRTSIGLAVEPAYGLGGLASADTIIVPAFADAPNREAPAPLVETLRHAYARGARLVSICVGSYLLAAAGLLDGRRATTHWMYADDFAKRFPAVEVDPTVLYVDEGQILTSAGTGSAIDLCLHIVRLDHGTAVANEVARRMVVAPHRDGGQAQFARPINRSAGAARTELAPVLDWARDNLDRPLTVAQLAQRAHRSARSFARHFRDELGTSPLQWLLEQRVRAAQELLETTDDPVESIAVRTGFGTAVNLRQHFRRVTSISPQTYRHVFRRRPDATARQLARELAPQPARQLAPQLVPHGC